MPAVGLYERLHNSRSRGIDAAKQLDFVLVILLTGRYLAGGGSMFRRHLGRMYWRAVWLVALYALRGLYLN
jgi:hypothetical protein